MKVVFIRFAFIALFLSCLFGWKVYKENRTVKNTSDTVKVLVIDTAWYPLIGLPKISDSVLVPVPVSVDTALILQRYFAKYCLTDSLIDSSLIAVIHDTVCQNRITSRTFSYKILKPTVVETFVNKSPLQNENLNFYFGGFAQGNSHSFGFGPELFMYSSERLYGLGYDLQNKSITLSFLFKIRK